MKIGVLALQGSFIEHVNMLRRLGVQTVQVRLAEHLEQLDGLIIPGGESTTIAKLAHASGLMSPLKSFVENMPTWGTCAGMIFLAKDIGTSQPTLGVMDIVVSRNAFGRQVDSFTTMLTVPQIEQGDKKPFPAIFIRAPKLVEARGDVKILAALPDGTGVAAREDKWLVTAFHPELTLDSRFHKYFLQMVKSSG